MQNAALKIMNEVRKCVVGKDEVIRRALMVVLAQGHILLEDIPGVGKTTLALAFSRAMSLDYRRMQFTPDVMPSDVTGFSVYDRATGELVYKPGAVLCNLFLADEINRTSSKTQSALLEVMEEGKVTVDGVTHPTPKPFLVIATQNPVGSAGTQLLPESQLDRFMVRLSMGYPGLQDEIEILRRRQGDDDPLEAVRPAAGIQEVLSMQSQTASVYLADDICAYIARLTAATRSDGKIRLGASPRGSIALARMAQAAAYLDGRDYTVPADVQDVFADVIGHRILLSTQAGLAGEHTKDVLGRILRETPAPSVLRR